VLGEGGSLGPAGAVLLEDEDLVAVGADGNLCRKREREKEKERKNSQSLHSLESGSRAWDPTKYLKKKINEKSI